MIDARLFFHFLIRSKTSSLEWSRVSTFIAQTGNYGVEYPFLRNCMHIATLVGIQVTVKLTFISSITRCYVFFYYSSGANIGSQAGSMMGFWSIMARMLAGMYFSSRTTRNMYSLNQSLVMMRLPCQP